MKKIEYIKNLIQKSKKNNTTNFDQEKDFLFEKFLSFEIPLEQLNDSELVTPEIYSYIDELEQQAQNNRYETGSYYTNKKLIKTIINNTDYKNKTIIDPAGGTGNFLIYLLLLLEKEFTTKSEFVNYINNYIYINEIKESSLNIYLIRLDLLSVKFFNQRLNQKDFNIIKKNCFQKDFLIDFKTDIKFDIIVGNPPYLGTKSLGKDYLNKIKNEFGFTDDLYSLFVFKSIDLLKDDGFLSFVTSSTYLTIQSKNRLRNHLIQNGLYKIIKNNPQHFAIKTKTATFFLRKNKLNSIKILNEYEIDKFEELRTIASKLDTRFTIFKNTHTDIFNICESIYNKYKKNISTTKSFELFSQTEEFSELIKNNEYLPLGLISYIATGVDFKGNNNKTLFSLDNEKYNIISNDNEIEKNPTKNDFINGLKNKKYIPAIKGKEHLFVLWSQNHVDYLKSIKAPLRNIRLYGEFDKLYCKTSTFDFNIVDKNYLCINTSGACFVLPAINISLEDLKDQITQDGIKNYLRENINNSLCLTPNDLKVIPIKIR